MANDTNDVSLRRIWDRAVERGKSEVLRTADRGRNRLRGQVLQRELEAMRIRLGKTAFRLYEEGEIQHPAIAKASNKIRELEDEIARLRLPAEEKPDL